MIAGHHLAVADPVLARQVSEVMKSYVGLRTEQGYVSAVRSFVHFCDVRGLRPWPVDPIVMAAWIIRIMSHIKPASLKVYCAALRYRQILEGFRWDLEGNPAIYRAKRWAQAKFPCKAKGAKFAVTIAVLRKVLPLLPGWPRLDRMSHEGRLFACASVHAVGGFLRGGEFLVSSGGVRATLLFTSVVAEVVQGRKASVIFVPQPKARWWLSEVRVPCFDTGDELSPPTIWAAYEAGSPAVARCKKGSSSMALLPAFHLAGGSPLSRTWLTRRTAVLCKEAGIPLCDSAGNEVVFKMASWRAGAVRSAVDAGLSDTMIMELGRWKSNAWRNYLLLSLVDVQGAARRMWARKAQGEGRGSSEMAYEEGAEAVSQGPDRVSQALSQKLARREQVVKRASLGFLPPKLVACVGPEVLKICAGLVSSQ